MSAPSWRNWTQKPMYNNESHVKPLDRADTPSLMQLSTNSNRGEKTKNRTQINKF